MNFKTTPDGDIELNALASPILIRGEEYIRQVIYNMFRTWLGSWFRDTSKGINYTAIFVKAYNKDAIIEDVERQLGRLDVVDEVVSVFFLIEKKRTAIINWTIRYQQSIISGQEEL